MKKGIYIENTPLEKAIQLWQETLSEHMAGPLLAESIPVQETLGRLTAEAVFALISSPFYHSSAMDGFAVRFSDTFGATETEPKSLALSEDAVYVDTGDPIPEGFNAVIMIEDVNRIVKDGQEVIEIIEPVTPWQHVRVIGEDIVSTELILTGGHRIRPVDIGAMLSGGHTEIKVRRLPRVAVIPTGTELVEPGEPLKKGDIVEFNSRILSSLVEQWGGRAIRFSPVPDDIEQITETLRKACELYDVVVINAGSSAGSEDYTAKALASLGKVLIHGVSIKPGKPVILGWVMGKPVLGIPGYPVSAYITFNLFGKMPVYALQGIDVPPAEVMSAKLSRQVASSLGQEEFLRVKLGRVGKNIVATPVGRGAGVLMSLVRADGFVRIPAMSEGYGAGTEVPVEMLREKDEIENTIVCTGSHDNALDLLANQLRKAFPKFSLSSAHVGSMGGIMALKKGEAHIAGTHLLDEATGEYNVPFLQSHLSGRKMLLVNLVYREQGFMVIKGNPKHIRDFGDLTRGDVCFINRQRGSGTRLLTDKHLKEQGILPGQITGYDREEYTHMGVASAVLTGIADTGMGILAAANALGLEFIPVAKERYDLAVPKDFALMPQIAAMLDIIRNDKEFRASVEGLGGYDVSEMGAIMYES
ncbi:MAG: molybdopterin biosynthesis protein [Nitrospirae bacterium]|nr:molybdopterin biosynthesis protein [Nitrospirota bacterium]